MVTPPESPGIFNGAFAGRDMSRRGVVLDLTVDHAGKTWEIDQITVKECEPFSLRPPAIQLTDQAAQALFDGLWGAGLRPSAEQDMPGEVAYLRKQLDRATKFAFGD